MSKRVTEEVREKEALWARLKTLIFNMKDIGDQGAF